jgi:multidrug efflux system membrane fusion protein
MRVFRCLILSLSTRAILLILLGLPFVLLLTSCSRSGAEATGNAQGTASGAQESGAGQPGSGRGNRTDGGGGSSRGGRGRGDAGGAVPVLTAKVSEMSMPVMLQGVGNVEAFSTVEVRPQVSGPLMTVNFNEGQDVTAGQLLFTIDPRPFELAVKQAEAALAKDAGQSKTAEVQRARYTNLMKSGLVSQADFDTVNAQANSLQSTLALDNVAIENARLQLQYTRITAPVTGRTGALQVHQGSLVRTADASPMVVINQITPVRVTFSLPSENLPEIRAGQARGPLVTEAVASGDTGTNVSNGALSFIDNAVDPTTAAIKLKATFANRDRKLWPGEFVQVRLRLSLDPHALVVPAAAVQNGVQGQYVYVVTPNRTVALRQVTVARTDANNAVIATGLQAGEEVVTDGQLRLTPGARISVRPPAGGSQP